jgi:hypothetical protein
MSKIEKLIEKIKVCCHYDDVHIVNGNDGSDTVISPENKSVEELFEELKNTPQEKIPTDEEFINLLNSDSAITEFLVETTDSIKDIKIDKDQILVYTKIDDVYHYKIF